jgi:predicted dehydrogenase
MADRKVRLGVIGAGAVVREIYQHLYFNSRYSKSIEVAAVAEPNPEVRAWFGDLAKLPENRRFASHKEMLAALQLDAVQVNTPDHLHAAPTIDSLNAGLHVVVPKPTAATVKDAHAMIEAARKNRRFLGIDFHKREDPRIKEAEARYHSGRYGKLQTAVFYMLDKLFVVDPNHSPRFFASTDFAEKNTPVSFLTVHMADALIKIVNLIPAQVRAVGYSQKLPKLSPISVRGYDLVDTEILFNNGALAHIITGWALPNSAWSTTVQSSRLVCSDGMIDLGLDTPGLVEIHPDGITQVNPLFRNFNKDGTVSGYGISSPGEMYEEILDLISGTKPSSSLEQTLDATSLGFYTTAVLEGAEESLRKGSLYADGVTLGAVVDLKELVAGQLGEAAGKTYMLA